jgi:hypothetical protein
LRMGTGCFQASAFKLHSLPASQLLPPGCWNLENTVLSGFSCPVSALVSGVSAAACRGAASLIKNETLVMH